MRRFETCRFLIAVMLIFGSVSCEAFWAPTLPGARSFDAGAEGSVVSRGVWAGRDGHRCSGSVELVEYPGEMVEVRFGPDFKVEIVPDPSIVVTSRESIGSELETAKGDVDLGILQSFSGAQSYVMPPGSRGSFVFVYCERYGLEVARAQLVE
ncbi:MAG: hypothetical protein HYV07_04360 [Deltaproteobacteria bacterium]|nr:hypothetical protein [Deltaproteobacteria bacterium]